MNQTTTAPLRTGLALAIAGMGSRVVWRSGARFPDAGTVVERGGDRRSRGVKAPRGDCGSAARCCRSPQRCSAPVAFQLFNSKNLVWSKRVHEYLMGAQTPMTALRAWNADSTPLPARMHSGYLRRLYLPVSFVLTSGGHNVGIVNPPVGPLVHPTASYRFASHMAGRTPADPRAWREAAAVCGGSWWPCWAVWLMQCSSGRIPAEPVAGLSEAGRPVLAPGTYVHMH